jgi:hypothetical protein
MIGMQTVSQEIKSKKSFLTRLGQIAIGIVALAVVAIAALMITGPLIGNTFSRINSSLAGISGGSAPVALSQLNTTFKAPNNERLIIRDGNITLVVKDPLATQKAIEKMISEMANAGAFIVSSNAYSAYNGAGLFNVDLTVRIPAPRFDEFMNRLAGMAIEVSNKTETAQDVTAEYVDLKARLGTLEAARERLLQIMKESTTTEALLLAEEQLTKREAEIESIKGRIQYLEQSAQLSSIVIRLVPDAVSQPIGPRWRPSETVRRAVDMLINGAKGFADFLIVFSIAVLPWLSLIYGIFLLVKRWRARQRQTSAKAEATQEKTDDKS